MAAVPLVSFRGITRLYGEGGGLVRALAGVDLDIAQGEFIAIMGPSGSGKSTAMNIIGCLDRPSSGSFRFAGVEVNDLSRDQRALLRRNFIGFVFQGFNLLARTSALAVNPPAPACRKRAPALVQRTSSPGTPVARRQVALPDTGVKGGSPRSASHNANPVRIQPGAASRTGVGPSPGTTWTSL